MEEQEKMHEIWKKVRNKEGQRKEKTTPYKNGEKTTIETNSYKSKLCKVVIYDAFSVWLWMKE